VLSEENLAMRMRWVESFALVDPLDGTREFVAGHDEYTINIAIVTEGRPIAGFIAVPALGLIFRGLTERGAERLALDRRGDRSRSVAARTVGSSRRRRPAAPTSMRRRKPCSIAST